jgi:hypothetical protein
VLFQTNATSRWNITTSGTNGANLRVYNYALASTVAAFDASGNLGLGATPSAWGSSERAIDVGVRGSVASVGDGTFNVFANSYVNTSGQYAYRNNGFASRHEQGSGQHRWFTAPSGTAGSAISFTQAMTLDATGALDVVGPVRGRSDAYFYGTGDRLNIFPLAAGSGANIVATNNGNTAYSKLNLDGSPVVISTAGTQRALFNSAGDFIHQVNGTAPTLSTNSTMSFELTSNTSLKIVVRGTDGVTRSATLTLT